MVKGEGKEMLHVSALNTFVCFTLHLFLRNYRECTVCSHKQTEYRLRGWVALVR